MGNTLLCVLVLFLLSTLLYYGHTQDAVLTLEPNYPRFFTGESITFTCDMGEGKSTDWHYKLNLEGYEFVRFSDSRYKLQLVQGYSGEYQCIGDRNISPYNRKSSNKVTLTVSAYVPKAILTAEKRIIPVGGSVTLTCSVEGSSDWEWDYYWYRRNTGPGEPVMKDGAPNSNRAISVSQGGLYWCQGGRGRHVFFTQTSGAFSIDKNVGNRAVVTLQPNWPQTYRRETITIRCEIQGGGDTEWEYEWHTTSSIEPPRQDEYRISSASVSNSGEYSCKGRSTTDRYTSTEWSDAIKLTVSNVPKPVLTLFPFWLSPGASATLSCEVEKSPAGWRFYWYKAVPQLSDDSYTYELLSGSGNGTAEGSYVIHGPTHTEGYMCRAERGDPVYRTQNSEPKFLWSGDRFPSASITVSPERAQLFRSESVSVRCEGSSAEWRVRTSTPTGHLTQCSSARGSMTGPACNISDVPQSAVYWCESGSGEFSNAVNITADYTDVILVSPVHPVTEGDSVTLSCKYRTGRLLSNVTFYRNDKLVQNTTTDNMTIRAVSKSDEGFYKCRHSRVESPQSWMTVRLSTPASSSYLVGLIVGPVIAFLLIVLLLPLRRCRKSKAACCDRPTQAQRTNQSSTTDQRANQNEAPDNGYPLQHGDANVYEMIEGSEETGKDESSDVLYSSIELFGKRKKGKHVDPDESAIYSDMKTGSATESSTPAEIEETVYSEVKKGTGP